jgi:hypothetical protein
MSGSAKRVFMLAASFMGRTLNSAIDREGFERLIPFFDARLQSVWELAEWPEITVCERRVAAEEWYPTAYNVGETRYDAATNSVQVVIDPGGVTAAETPALSDKWLPVLRDWEAAVWSATTTYSYGDRAYSPESGATYAYVGIDSGLNISLSDSSKWTALPEGLGDFPLVDANTRLFTMGTIFQVTPDDPRRHNTNGSPLQFWIGDGSVRVAGDPASAWFRYRTVCPTVMGGVYDPTVTYTSGEVTYYESAGDGHFYCLKYATAAGTVPTNTSYWSPITFSRSMERILAVGIWADWLRSEGQDDKAARVEAVDMENAEMAALQVHVRQQRQFGQLRSQR